MNADKVASFCASLAFCVASPISLAQYADHELCSQLNVIQLPEISGEMTSSEPMDKFLAEYAELNPEPLEAALAVDEGTVFLTLATCFRGGYAVAEDRSAANSLLRVAAHLGNEQAQHMIASIDLFESDDPSRQRRGFLAMKSEYDDRGSAFAAGKLGWAYQRGLGVKPDLDKAMELYGFAAAKGMTYWQILLAHAYEKGYLGLEISDQHANEWRKFEPKVHGALYECWVASYYRDGIFPANRELQSSYQRICEEPGKAELWDYFSARSQK